MTSLDFLVLRGQATLHLDATPVKDIIVCVPLKKIMRHVKQIKLILMLSHYSEDGVFLLKVVYELVKGLVLLTMI